MRNSYFGDPARHQKKYQFPFVHKKKKQKNKKKKENAKLDNRSEARGDESRGRRAIVARRRYSPLTNLGSRSAEYFPRVPRCRGEAHFAMHLVILSRRNRSFAGRTSDGTMRLSQVHVCTDIQRAGRASAPIYDLSRRCNVRRKKGSFSLSLFHSRTA